MFRTHPGTLLKRRFCRRHCDGCGGSPFGVRQPDCRSVTSRACTRASPDSYYTMRLSPSPVAVQQCRTDRHLVPGRGRSARHAGNAERQRPAGWRHGVVLAVRSRDRRPFGPDLDRRNLERGRRVRGHRHGDDVEQRSHRHLRATRPHDQRVLTWAAWGVPDYACTARAQVVLPRAAAPANGCPCLASPSTPDKPEPGVLHAAHGSSRMIADRAKSAIRSSA